MTVETATTINQLDASYPASTDAKNEGDNHIRLLKSTVKATFPNVTGAVSVSHTDINSVTGKVATADLALSTGAALVGSIQTGTGAASRTVQDKLRDLILDSDYDTAQHAATAALGKVHSVAAGASVTVTVPSDAADLSAAMTAIARWVIPDTSTVTINLPTGTTTASSPILLQHPYGARITIMGVAPVTTSITAASAPSGSAGAWSTDFTVSSGTGIAANDYCLVRTTAGTGAHEAFAGICKITNVVGNTVTVTNTGRFVAWPTSALTGATLTVLKTVLKFTGCDGLRVGTPIGRIDKLAIVGDRTAGTVGLITNRGDIANQAKAHIFCGDGTSASAFGVSSFGDGCAYAQYGGAIMAAYCCFADALVYNVLAQHGGSVMANYAVANGSTQVGFAGSNSGDCSCEYAVSTGNGTYNFYTQSSGSISLPNATSKCAVSDGIRAAYGGSIRGQTVTSSNNGGSGAFSVGAAIVLSSSTFASNASSGLYAEGGGNIYAGSSTCSSNTGYGAYADGAVIDMPSATVSSNTINGVTATNGGVILAASLGGVSNSTYFVSASKGGMVRATSASTSGATINSDSGGLVDANGATGTPVLNIGAGGRIVDTGGTLLWGQIVTYKDSTYNSESTAAAILKNITDPLKWVVSGYDNTRDYGYVQALRSTSGYKPYAINPNGGNVGIGLAATAPTARLHLPAGAAGAGNAPLKLTSGTNLTTPEAGAFEYDGTTLYFTTGAGRKTVTLV